MNEINVPAQSLEPITPKSDHDDNLGKGEREFALEMLGLG